MKITTVLFDLDGTLLPMDQEAFTKAYFRELCLKLAPYGYEPEKLVDAVWKGTRAMVNSCGEKSNEDIFWEEFSKIFGEKCLKDKAVFDDFYHNEFEHVQSSCGFDQRARETVRQVKDMGLRIALATNPIFPAAATESRIRWAGLQPEAFELYTTYENIHSCKPNISYYEEILKKLGVKPEECLMAGNDVTEDMAAEKTGMKVFLLTDCLINREKKDISSYPHGSFEELLRFLRNF